MIVDNEDDASAFAASERADSETIALSRGCAPCPSPKHDFRSAQFALIAAAVGCAPAVPIYEPPEAVPIAATEMEGVVTGVVHYPDGHPIEGAFVIAMATALPEQRETRTDADGSFRFEDLPPGHYTIQVLYERGNVSEIIDIGSGRGWHLRFALDPDPPY